MFSLSLILTSFLPFFTCARKASGQDCARWSTAFVSTLFSAVPMFEDEGPDSRAAQSGSSKPTSAVVAPGPARESAACACSNNPFTSSMLTASSPSLPWLLLLLDEDEEDSYTSARAIGDSAAQNCWAFRFRDAIIDGVLVLPSVAAVLSACKVSCKARTSEAARALRNEAGTAGPIVLESLMPLLPPLLLPLLRRPRGIAAVWKASGQKMGLACCDAAHTSKHSAWQVSSSCTRRARMAFSDDVFGGANDEVTL